MSKVPKDPHILNLRKLTVLGGVYHVNYLHQPPQPQEFASVPNLSITRLYLPKELQHVDFFAEYEPPAATDPNVRKQPEQIEEEMRKQEEALDGLIFIDLTWPQHVIFLELPIVCIWIEEDKCWTKKYVHDLKHNEEKGTLSFMTQCFGIFGLATLRYANLPFQAWDIKPESDGSITFNITTAIIILEFNIKNGLMCISQLQNSPNKALLDQIGKYVKLHVIKKMLKKTGIDIFPEHDAYCYVDGSCEKYWPMEKHLYSNMSLICGVFNFAWSRWNASQGKKTIVIQIREYAPEKTKQRPHSILLVSPVKTCYINCTEVSQVFCNEPVEGLKFSADLYTLMKSTTGIFVRKKIESYSKQNICAVYEFLIATRIISFS
ncbi:unnamed protein product [Psylliodes chrysocephalus]|uniref:CASC1 C-terminal domain-containing protein n=1 Tax=Psylliodes chrysocephalus TaxID=3402493 RepID=A0A9P0CQ75_9CUCU|nr:unnamed protein product [Psylliodes chrysocephala]